MSGMRQAMAGLASLAILSCMAMASQADERSLQIPARLDPVVEQHWANQLKQPDTGSASDRAPIRLASHKSRERRGGLFGSRRRATTGADIVYGRRNTQDRPQVSHKREMAPIYLPAVVDFDMSYAPGTIIIDTQSRFLYLVLQDGQARRYGVGIGRDGFGWTGSVKIGRKAEWPGWTPPAEMRRRQPGLPAYMEGGIDNPLGARALYLYKGGRDTIYRIHGSNEPWTIGLAVSSGCFRMRNEDVTDLYERVGVGTRVVVL